MILTPEQIKGIVDEDITQIRLLKKEGEKLFPAGICRPERRDYSCCVMKNLKTMKYLTGKDYVVQTAPNKKGVWWCPECKHIDCTPPKKKLKVPYLCDCRSYGDGRCSGREVALKPLRIKIIKIIEQNLFYATKKDIWKEGKKIEWKNHTYYRCMIGKAYPKGPLPDTWVLGIEVMKCSV